MRSFCLHVSIFVLGFFYSAEANSKDCSHRVRLAELDAMEPQSDFRSNENPVLVLATVAENFVNGKYDKLSPEPLYEPTRSYVMPGGLPYTDLKNKDRIIL